ncbi:hypothetical protein, partial [Saccharococcus caldoxylosilyticus]
MRQVKNFFVHLPVWQVFFYCIHNLFTIRSNIVHLFWKKSDFLHSLRLVPLAIMLADFQKERSIP